jgi:hypothetical protein
MNKQLEKTVRDALAFGKIIGDGHTIFAPSFYEPFFSKDFLKDAGLIRNYNSDLSDFKKTITNTEGIVVEQLKDSVYNLDFLHWLHSQLGISEPVTMYGRGSQTRQIVEQIRNHVGEAEIVAW